MSRVLNVILSHQSAVDVKQLLRWWSSYVPDQNVLLAYGGNEEEFNKLPDVPRIFITDTRLRVDKTREKQSYAGIWRATVQWLQKGGNGLFSHVYFAEFDHLPLVSNLAENLLGRLEQEQADVLGHGLCRVDQTSNVLYLHHLADPEFRKFWRHVSIRSDQEVVLRMLGTGSFWTYEAFTDIGRRSEDVSIYLEVYLPTLAHHLGYRVRDFGDQNRCVSPIPKPQCSVERARELGCWTVHPIKTIPNGR